MEPIAQYEIPFLHPLAVHFPLVLLLLGAGAAAFYLVLGRAVWRQAGLVLFALGAVGAWAAGETGHDLYQAVEGDPIVEDVVGLHRDGAEWTLWSSAAGALAFGVASAARLRRTGRADPEGAGPRGRAGLEDARAAVGALARVRTGVRRRGLGRVDRAPRRDHGVGRPPMRPS